MCHSFAEILALSLSTNTHASCVYARKPIHHFLRWCDEDEGAAGKKSRPDERNKQN